METKKDLKEFLLTLNKIDETYGKVTFFGSSLIGGRLIEIYDDIHSEKTTLTLKFISEAQKLGEIAVVIGIGDSFDSNYAEQLGVDLENLIVSKIDDKEQAMEIAESFIHSDVIDIIVIIDSAS